MPGDCSCRVRPHLAARSVPMRCTLSGWSRRPVWPYTPEIGADIGSRTNESVRNSRIRRWARAEIGRRPENHWNKMETYSQLSGRCSRVNKQQTQPTPERGRKVSSYLRNRNVSTANVACTMICANKPFMASGNVAKLSEKRNKWWWV